MEMISNEQLIFLDNLIYLDISEFEGETLCHAVDRIIENIDKYMGDKPPACMSRDEWLHLLNSFCYEDFENGVVKEKNREFLENYVIEQYDDERTRENLAEEGFRACSFVKRNDNNNKEVEDVVVIFRGTAGDAIEWEDNVLNANRVWSDELDKSVLYIQDLKAVYGEAANHITVSGHSKGGNRAQYVTILTDQIDRCLSFDGQGVFK